MDRDLPAEPRPGVDALVLKHDGKKSGGHLLAGGDDRVVFARVVQDGGGPAEADELVGSARHGRDDDRHLVPRVHLALHVPRDVSDEIHVGDGRSAEFHHKPGHAVKIFREAGAGRSGIATPKCREHRRFPPIPALYRLPSPPATALRLGPPQVAKDLPIGRGEAK